VDGSELARLFFTFAGWSVQAAHIDGTSVPVEEPSTVSKAAVSNRSKAAPYSITSSAL
jgi:hypothetical protein